MTLDGLVRRRRRRPVRSCRHRQGPHPKVCLRPEREGRFALPRPGFGLDVIASVGAARHAAHRSIPEIHAELVRRGVPIRARGVADLRDRSDAWLALSGSDGERRRAVAAQAGRVVRAIDGPHPDARHAVLWVIRDLLSGEVLLARGPPSSSQDDLAKLRGAVQGASPVPITGVVSDGRTSIRQAVARAPDGVPRQLGHFPCLREAATPVYAADRHAKVQPKKKVRATRPIERKVEGRKDAEAESIRGGRAAVRAAPTGAGRPPREASGSKLADRLTKVADRPDRVGAKRGSRSD